MIVLDTNVISELMHSEPHPVVFDWMAAQPRKTLYTSAIVVAEIQFGIALMRERKKKAALQTAANGLFDEDMDNRVLSFDEDCAAHYAKLVSQRRRAGHPLVGFDGLIAATAFAAGASLATRNISDFEGCGLTLINPWET